MTVEDKYPLGLGDDGDVAIEYQKEKLESLISEFGLNKVRKKLGRPAFGWRAASCGDWPAVWRSIRSFIMLDEPFAGVDPIAVQDIQTIVARLKHKNIGILITDHNGVRDIEYL